MNVNSFIPLLLTPIMLDSNSFEREKVYPREYYPTSTSRESSEAENSEIVCSVSKAVFTDKNNEVFGYPLMVTLDKFQRIYITPIPQRMCESTYLSFLKPLPQDKNCLYNVQIKSKVMPTFNAWIPAYINKEHFKRAEKKIMQRLNAIVTGDINVSARDLKIEDGAVILFKILNQLMVSLLKSPEEENAGTIKAFFQFYFLLVNLIRIYPEIENDVNAQVEKMLISHYYREKRRLGDIGEFIIKLAVSKYGIFDQAINTTLLEEYAARQVMWVLKEDPNMANARSLGSRREWLNRYFQCSKVSNQLLVMNMYAARTFLNTKTLAQLVENDGFPTKTTVGKFLDTVTWIKTRLTNFEEFFQMIGFDKEYPDDYAAQKYIKKAFQVSKEQNYTTELLRE